MISSEEELFVDHVDHSVGGFGGHAFRRLTHISMSIVPLLYYVYGVEISKAVSLEPKQFVSLVCILIMVIEAIRLRTGIVIIGQREYESRQISALAWGTLSVSLALLISTDYDLNGIESGLYGIPIIFGLTFVDPIMGEIKRKKKDMKLAIIVGLFASYFIWISCYFWLGTEIMAVILLAPLTVLGEIPSVEFIDDNATMVLFPMVGLELLKPFL